MALNEKELPSEKEILYRTNGTMMRIADALEAIKELLDKRLK